MLDIPEVKESLRRTVLDYYREECKEMQDAWRALEVKAQGNVAVAGIFIAGALAYLREIHANMPLPVRGLFLVTLLFLIGSVICSILALTTRKSEAPEMGDYVLGLANDVLKLDDAEIVERLSFFFDDQMAGWKKVRMDAATLITTKARYLSYAQAFVIAAIIPIAILTVMKIFVK